MVPRWVEISGSEGAVPVCGVLYAAEGSDAAALAAVASEFSPRVEVCGPREIALDLSGLSRLFGDAKTIAAELRRTAADRGLRVRVAIAGTRTAARLLVRHRAGMTVVDAGTEAAALAGLPLALLQELAGNPTSQIPHPEEIPNPRSQIKNSFKDQRSKITNDCAALRRWGLKTLGELAALPPDDVMARLGLTGVELQRLACGEDGRPLVPSLPEERFEQSLELEWPIDGLEPLSFVLGRLMEPLAAHLERRGRGAAVLHVRLRLVTKVEADEAGQQGRAMHVRTLELPAPMREARTLRTLAMLDLESHPPSAAIDAVTVAVDPTAARVVQYSLLTRPLPTPEQLSTLMARVQALMGETRVGAPATVDSWRPGAFVMKPFVPREPRTQHSEPRTTPPAPRTSHGSPACLRRFRHAVPVRVQLDAGAPVRLVIDRRGMAGGRVSSCAGPWRTSGAWWVDDVKARECPWNRDEWDVALDGGVTYRLFRDRDRDAWFVEGVLD
jgi:protein ImuB